MRTDWPRMRSMTAVDPLLLHNLPDTLQWRPAAGPAQQLMLLLHGWCGLPADMAPTAQVLQQAFPQALLLAPQGFDAADGGRAVRQWYSLAADGAGLALDDAQRAQRVAAALPALADAVRAAQAASGLAPAATALVGFGQGADMALALSDQVDGLAGRVLAFAGRYARWPERAPQLTTLHFFPGEDDLVAPVALLREAIGRLAALRADATVDIARGVGHQLHPALLRCALQRLSTHIPQRTWAEAMGAAPR